MINIEESNCFFKFLVFVFIFFFINQWFVPVSDSRINSNELLGESNVLPLLTSPKILYVGGSGPGNYSTIQDAINNASDGDTIYVYNGTYKENILIKKILNLIGESRNNVIIDGGDSGNTIKITVNNVSISSFTIKNGGIGVYIVRSCNHTIYNNKIIDNWEGVGLLESSGTNLSTNIISNNFFEGINPVQSSSVFILGNTITGNLQGIFISKSGNNTIFGNNIKSNTRGIEIRSSSNKNLIYHNNFINNAEDNAFDECSNSWDNGYPSGGNYWDDYTGKDEDGDGIGETPYSIDGDSNKDYYPFINQSGWNQPPNQPSNPSPENGSTSVDINADLYWKGGDPDPGDIVTYDVYFGENCPPPLVEHNQSDTSYNPGIMKYNTSYYWKIVAWDNLGASNESPIWIFSTLTTPNNPPNTPNKPNGTDFGFIYIPYNYSTISSDPNDDNLSYGWDWDGDLRVDEWSDWYTSNETCMLSHTWNAPGTFKVHVKAKDTHFAESNWSTSLTITIAVENNPPNAPKIDGPTNGKKGIEYEYVLNATDPDGNNIKYFVDWGDGDEGWTNYYTSGTEINLKHTWTKIGTYTIRTKAKDIFDAESDWETLKVVMPKSQHMVINWLLESLPRLFTMLKYMLGLS